MKVTLEQVDMTLTEREVPVETRTAILNDLEKALKEEKENKEPTKRKKGNFILVQPGEDKLYYLLKVKAEFNITTLGQSLLNVRAAYNDSKKGKKVPAQSHVDCFELAKAKDFKGEGLQLLSKEPIIIVEEREPV